jgi:hypothetical protein
MLDPIDLGEFERRTNLRPTAADWKGADRIVSLRDIKRITFSIDMDDVYLSTLLMSTTLTSDPGRRPYEGCSIKRLRTDPAMLSVGQTFVEERKLLDLQAAFCDIFEGTGALRGFAKRGAKIIIGETHGGEQAIAHYLPPIIEVHGHRNVLLDGVHRCWSVMRIGTTIEAIRVFFPKDEFPCDLGSWKDVRMVSAKPPKPERFFGLKPDLFRDLKYVGIDG